MSMNDAVTAIDVATDAKNAQRLANGKYLLKKAVLPGLVIGAAVLTVIAVANRYVNNEDPQTEE